MPRHCAGAAWLGGRDRRSGTVKLGGDRRGGTVKLGRDRRATVKTGGARRARTADLNTAESLIDSARNRRKDSGFRLLPEWQLGRR